MKRFLLSLLVTGSAALAGCSASLSSSDAAGGGGAAAPSGASAEGAGGSSGSAKGESGAGAPANDAPQSGQLTAGVWDDNLNFDFFQKYLGETTNLPGLPVFSPSERVAARDKALAPRGSLQDLDVAFLLDTTGSMGDELRYLQSEVDAIAGTLKEKFPQTAPRFGLVLYKDHGDQYVTRWFDFTSSLAVFQEELAAQSASGGGDYPEAVPEGLQQAMSLQWRSGPVARMVFWIGDAPHHEGTEGSVKSSIQTAIQQDIHLYPVAASGADERTERTLRAAAQITGGRYLFLTDDSGIGNAHKEPRIPCYHVTRFDSAMVRMVESELTGRHVQPAEGEILRTVGEPKDGKCTLASQEQVTIY